MEGPDCSGKSTFIERLNQALDLHRRPRVNLKFGPPDPWDRDVFEEYEHALDAHDRTGTVVVCDRLHWGERIYGPLLRGRDRLGTAGWRHVELSLAARDTLVVYVSGDEPALRRCLEGRGDHLVAPHQLGPILEGYRWCLEHTALPVLVLHHLDFGAADLVATVADREAELETTRTWVGESFLGNRYPDLLLFGENRGGEPPHHGDRFAFTPRNSTSGRWLLEALPDRLWPHLGLANACDQDDPDTVWRALGKPPTVALGGAAHLALSTARVPHAAVPHPQFVRRFLHSQLDGYGQLIERLAGTTINNLDWRGTVGTDRSFDGRTDAEAAADDATWD